MEANNFSEKESLELIIKMINSTKDSMDVGRWNQFVVWGTFTVLLGLAILGLMAYTGNPEWNWLWFLMFVFWYSQKLIADRKPQPVVTYNSKAISSVWKVLGFLFALTPITLTILTFLGYDLISMTLMMPLSLIYMGIGVSFSGIILHEPFVAYIPIVCMISPIVMFNIILVNHGVTLGWYFIYLLTVFVMMVIPGIILHYKTINRK
ncbi:MAG: hypothetical protein ACTTJK_11320 [Phocaeicola sp.]|uniref:hypothetical protein n=1 Tax=Phocaeicola sp. TaxID=2773926 RepID=UPI003F9F2282